MHLSLLTSNYRTASGTTQHCKSFRVSCCQTRWTATCCGAGSSVSCASAHSISWNGSSSSEQQRTQRPRATSSAWLETEIAARHFEVDLEAVGSCPLPEMPHVLCRKRRLRGDRAWSGPNDAEWTAMDASSGKSNGRIRTESILKPRCRPCWIMRAKSRCRRDTPACRSPSLSGWRIR